MNPRPEPAIHPTDEDLLRAFARGRERAFELLVQRHGASVKGYALRMLRSPEEAEEVFEEVFVRLAKTEGRWQERGTVRGFLFTIAHRLCLDILRRRKVARLAVPGLVALADSRPVTPSPEAAVLLGERASQLERALERLPTEHRQILLLRVVHGLSAAEVGAALELRESQVHSAVAYARRRLRKLLEEDAVPARTGEGRS